jgi:hypothetical protein
MVYTILPRAYITITCDYHGVLLDQAFLGRLNGHRQIAVSSYHGLPINPY